MTQDELKDYAAKRQAERGGLAETVKAITAAVPEMKTDDSRKSYRYRQQMLWQGGNFYLRAYAHNDGSMNIEWMPSVSVDEFAEIATILRRR